MKKYLHSELNDDDKLFLTNLYHTSTKHWLRVRCQSIILNQTMIVPDIAQIMAKQEATIRGWINSFKKDGRLSLIIKPGRGLKPKLAVDNLKVIEIVIEQLDNNPLKLNHVIDKLSKELDTIISKKI